MKKMTKTMLLVAVLVPGLLLYLTPYFAVREMRAAAESGDEARFSEHINYRVLKANMKADFNAKLQNEMAKQTSSNALSSFGANFASAFVNPLIDTLVTPQSMAAILSGRRMRLQENPAQADSRSAAQRETDVVSRYESLNRFIVAVKRTASNDAPVELIFEREGLATWKVIAIRLPL